MTITSLSQRQKGLLAAVTTATCWSFLAILLKFALIYSDAYTIVWYRMAVPFIILLFWIRHKEGSSALKVLTQKSFVLLIAALCLAFNYIGFMQGVHYTSPANAQIFIQTGPLLLALSGILFFNEKLNILQTCGFILCIAGFYLFFLDRQDQIAANKDSFALGFLWIMGAAATWAVFASLQKKLFHIWSNNQINLYIYLISTLVFIPFVDWQNLISIPWWAHILYVFLGLNTLVAYGSLSVALKSLPATQVSPIITMNPLFTLLFLAIMEFFSWQIIPSDPIHWQGYLGAILAVSGVILVVTKKSTRKTS